MRKRDRLILLIKFLCSTHLIHVKLEHLARRRSRERRNRRRGETSAFPRLSGKKPPRHSCVIRVSRICYANLSRLFCRGGAIIARARCRKNSRERNALESRVQCGGARRVRALVNEASGDFTPRGKIPSARRKSNCTREMASTDNLSNSVAACTN